MTTPLPSEMLPAGHVVGRVARATGDTTADTDSDPEMTPIVGEGLVVFVNSRVSQVVTSTSPDMLVLHDPVLADLDADGVLSVAGVQGVELWPGTWKVTPGNRSVFDFPDFTVTVTSAHTADDPLQLWGVAPPDPAPGVPVYTLTVPTGQQPGQTLGWDGSQLAWVTPTITPTATTLAAGSDATATMSGSWPNLTLGLGIPAGQPSTYQIVGAGRPDIPASMTTAVQAQVAAAPVGSTFSSTDGASVGAWQWQKLPTGWRVVVLDTAMRWGSAANGWTASSIGLRRCGNVVEFQFKGLNPSAATSDVFYSLPAGFRPAFTYIGWSVIRPSWSSYGAVNMAFISTGPTMRMLGSGIVGSSSVISPDMSNQASWVTSDACPTVLPS